MPEVSKIGDVVKFYSTYGLELEDHGDEARGECPWCGKEEKFYASTDTGLWDCKSCGKAGNPLVFLRELWNRSDTRDLEPLAKKRKLLSVETLIRWGVRRSFLTRGYILPGYNREGALVNLYRYAKVKGGKHALLSAPDSGHGMFNISSFDPAKPRIYVTEGPWDGMALEEVLGRTKEGEDGLLPTSNPGVSLLTGVNVISMPGCNVFLEHWTPLFAGAEVVFLYDSDHPRTQPDGKIVSPPGMTGAKRACEILAESTEPPERVLYLEWGKNGYDPDLPSGYDVRDHLSQAGNTSGSRIPALRSLLDRVTPIPEEWVAGRDAKSRKRGALHLEVLPCTEWKELVKQWKKAAKWFDGLERALSVMLASMMSTESLGVPLWVKVVAPPSGGKTMLCEALQVARQYVFPKDVITGLFSGYQTDREGSEDVSLAPLLHNKSLIIKDGDTLLQMPNLGQILSQFRALYDKSVRVQYRNKMSRDHENLNVTVIICGTESLRSLDSSELGERLLDCVIADQLDPDTEDSIALRKIYQEAEDVNHKADGKPETRDPMDMVLAKQLTGGYVTHLRRNAQELLSQVHSPDESTALKLLAYGTFVSYMRSRPSKRQEETQQRELSTRLCAQLTRLSKCVAVVLGKRYMNDSEVMDVVRRVALDTARGRTLEIVKHLFPLGKIGVGSDAVTMWTHGTAQKTEDLLRFLRRIGAVESFRHKDANTPNGRQHWRLTPRLESLYREIYDA